MKFCSALFFAALLFPLSSALAQESDDIRLRVGLGVQSRPEFIGADKNAWAPLWDLAIKRGTDPFEFEAPDDSFDIRLFSKRGFSIGPVANIQNGRKESEIDAPLGKVSATVEAGAFS
jgi:outer membrane protein